MEGVGGGSGKPLTPNMQLNHLEREHASMVTEAKAVAGGEESDEYKRQFAEYHNQKLAKLNEHISELINRGAKSESESGAEPFVYNPSKELKVEPSMLSGIGDWFSHKKDGTTPKPVATPTPKPIGKSPTTSSNW